MVLGNDGKLWVVLRSGMFGQPGRRLMATCRHFNSLKIYSAEAACWCLGWTASYG